MFKEFADSEEKQFKDGCDMSEPSEVHPPGIDAARQWYLFEPFCRSNLAADMTCPKPTVPKPGLDSSAGSTSRKRTVTLSELPETPTQKRKRKRLCSHCRSNTHLKTKKGKIVPCYCLNRKNSFRTFCGFFWSCFGDVCN